MAKTLKLWIDTDNGSLYQSFNSSSTLPKIEFLQGDKVDVEVHLVKVVNGFMNEVAFPSGSVLRMALGKIDASATSGTYTIAYNGQTTSPLAYSATEAQIQTALNALSTIVSAGGVTVSKFSNSMFSVSFNAIGTNYPFEVDGSLLNPPCATKSITLKAGSGSVKGECLIKVKQSPVAYQDSFSDLTQPSISTTILTANQSKRVTISPEPRAGTWSITGTGDLQRKVQLSNDGLLDPDWWDENYTARVSINASASDTQFTYLNYDVAKVDNFTWDFSLKPYATPPVGYTMPFTASGSGLIGFTGKVGNLDLNTAEVEYLLNGASSVTTNLELELEESGGNKRTLLQTTCTIKNDLIDQSNFSPLSFINSIVWGDLGGTLSNQTDLQSALNGKLPLTGGTITGATTIENADLTITNGNFNLHSDADPDSTFYIGDGGSYFNNVTKNEFLFGTDNARIQNQTTGVYSELGVGTFTLNQSPTSASIDDFRILDAANKWYVTMGSGYIMLNDGNQTAGNENRVKFSLEEGNLIKNGLEIRDSEFQVTRYDTSLVTYINDLGIEVIHATNGDYTLIAPNRVYVGNNGNGDFVELNGNDGIKFSDSTIQGTAGLPLLGGTLTGKLNLNPTGTTTAPLNIKTGITPTTPLAGDVWITTDALNYRNTTGVTRVVATLGNNNPFTNYQSITVGNNSNPALSVTQTGTADAFVVNDSSPDSTPFRIDANGRVGIGIAPDATVALNVDSTGIKFNSSATAQTVPYIASDVLLKADNLSGLANTTTARTNLGLGSMATETASNYALLTGATFTGKVNISAGATASPINIGAGVSPSGAGTAGDIWIGGTNLAYKDSTNTLRTTVTTSQSNTFTNFQTITQGNSVNPSLAVTQTGAGGGVLITNTGAGYSFKVEDSTSPDATPFAIDQNGRTGIGVAPDATVALNVDSTGIKFNGSTAQTVPFLPPPSDGNYYVYRNGVWTIATIFASGGKNYLTI
jgi:hypothetical protein